MLNLEHICLETVEIAKQAVEYIKAQRTGFSYDRVETKGLHDFVSHVDRETERILVDKLKALLPESGFIAEEGTGVLVDNGYNWIVDPLDGTTNFIHGLSPFAVSIALSKDNKILQGVVYEVSLDECFYSWVGAPAYLNGSIIKVSPIKKVDDSLVATGFPYYNYGRLEQYMKTMEYFMRHSHGLRRLGSAATDLAYVACGRFDAFYEYGLQPWDVAAGAFLVQQAGGKVSDFTGTENYIFGKEIIATNSSIFNEFKHTIAEIMNC
jgi:myo-inositol-1(or 4)-monophosphatase